MQNAMKFTVTVYVAIDEVDPASPDEVFDHLHDELSHLCSMDNALCAFENPQYKGTSLIPVEILD